MSMKHKMIKCNICNQWMKTIYIRNQHKLIKVGLVCISCNNSKFSGSEHKNDELNFTEIKNTISQIEKELHELKGTR